MPTAMTSMPAPLTPSKDSRKGYKDNITPQGPIGHMLQAILLTGATIDNNLAILTPNEPTLHITRPPPPLPKNNQQTLSPFLLRRRAAVVYPRHV